MNSPSDDERESLGSLLRKARTRLRAESLFLAGLARLPSRVGKPVSQEEVAESVGISREWYSSIESGKARRISAVTLGRVATALMLSPAERARAFQLAVPEFASVTLAADSMDVLEGFSFVRRCADRLLSATSVDEILAVAQRFSNERISCDMVSAAVRNGEDDWKVSITTRETPIGTAEYELFKSALLERYGAGVIDDMHAYTIFTRPGEAIAKEDLDARFRSRAEKLNPFYEMVGLEEHQYLMACIASRSGLVGRLIPTQTSGGAFSKTDLAVLGAVADVASLALSS